MLVSVICPVLNGSKYIEKNIIKYFLNSKPENKELIIVDGGSTDKTKSIIQKFIQKYPNILLIDNPHKYVPHALNIAIKQSKGKYIARLDVHTEYPVNYLEKCIDLVQKTNAANVGGTLISSGFSKKGLAISHCMSSIFGVGNSIPRIKKFDGFVDAVAFGFWERKVFEKYGLFDELLIKNQDEDHNFRIKEMGGKIYQSSTLLTKYYVREKFIGLIKQMFNYGKYKPLVLSRNVDRIRIRHIIPTVFTLYLISLLFFTNIITLIPIVLYLIINIIFSFKSDKSISIKIVCIITYLLMHVSYGSGFIVGLIKGKRN